MNIPVVILCGGQGTRIRGDTLTKKELVTVGGRPIIWHVMRFFSAYGFNRFILTLGYGADQLKRYFLEYETFGRDFNLQLAPAQDHNHQVRVEYLGRPAHDPWQVSLVDTGLKTEKATRIVRVAPYLEADRFFVAYGDDVSDVNLHELVAFHQQHGKLATITGVQVQLEYGLVEAEADGRVTGFVERPPLPYWIHGGFMVFERPVLDIMAQGDDVNLETEVLPTLAAQGELMMYHHQGFWQSMNTMKDNLLLEELWQQGAPWKVW